MKDFIKFSTWLKLREDGVAAGGVSVGGSAPSAVDSSPNTPAPPADPPSNGNSSNSSDGGLKAKDIAPRPSVVGCGYCYPFCGGNTKANKKKKRRKKKKGKK